MKRYYKCFFSFSILMMFFSCLPMLGSAQIIGGDDCETFNDPFVVCPIDGGLGVLIAIGVGYGIKKVKEMRGNG